MTSPSQARTRLHITPFDSDLLPLVLPASIRPLATDISYHSIPTFPENNYGYVTLPTMEADKIKKKLNGSILKGRKFKVDSARPPKRHSDEEDGQKTTSSDNPPSAKKPKKRNSKENVLEGYELPSDRKVKRGWTESATDKTERRKKEKKAKSKKDKQAKSQLKSKYTEKAECLFRTQLPPNRSSTEDERSKKQAKRKGKSSRESVVHEFSNTLTHPTFIRSDDGGKPLTSTFEEGKGWVDESGDVIEALTERIREDQYTPGQIAGHREKPRNVKDKSPVQAETLSKINSKGDATKPKEAESSGSEDWTSSGGSSSEEDGTDSESDTNVASISSEESEDSVAEYPQKEGHPSAPYSASKDQDSSTESKALPKDDGHSVDREQQPAEVHPLEALFKKPATDKEPVSEPAQFSFFGQGDEESEEEMPKNIEPLTPFTKRDLQDRGLRSAAPTPDTSHVTRTIYWNSEEPDEEASIYTDSPFPKPGAYTKEESDFAKWFWENRGDNNPPASFCKCTCFSNSTIIPLDPGKGDSSFHNTFNLLTRNDDIDSFTYKRAGNYRSLSCNDCNRKFCLGYDLPTCKGAKEDDVFTTCFQRDSRKDEAIVFIFIIATGSLLIWAVLRPWVQKWIEAARERQSYMPVSASPRL
ncbi:hypothetical protein BJX61DRAFT_534386 [Aspergillus egyptiacus]|nr:hypothetical protein BJX61DRAFT_534386 [Aspergillus egyptiacus]